ncbi:hypothetical protein TW95_gp0822 [Pandoravirus inopinatum]|uniref:Uncharacterized protein n=1 Tax=Pandoravirus inopinatum TaxID=1605721 RepID=A0A0B5J9K3_9VIRU|nr:hypothetical protein TW95_gp0822 [Pandoravirus inopinatum]AJF97556.1 hypothetical protein [Pandoravirus inopinatum]
MAAADHQYAWRESLPSEAWGRWPHVVGWLLEHVPLTRIFGAFENRGAFDTGAHTTKEGHAKISHCQGRPRSVVPSTLFDTCVRVIVPFAVVDAALQAQLPMLVGSPFDPSGDPPEPVDQQADDERPWWVSVTCRGDPVPLVGWLERVDARDAMRLAAQQWARLVWRRGATQPCEPWTHGHSKPKQCGPFGPDDWVACTGLHYEEWLRISDIGYRRITTRDTPAHDVVLMRIISGFFISWYVTRQEARTMRRQVALHGRRVPHPWIRRIHVYYTSRNKGDMVVGWVEGDPHFLLELDCRRGHRLLDALHAIDVRRA